MSVLAQIVLVVRKDLLIEWRSRSRAFALACFATRGVEGP